jgi:hypothetical protein
VVFAKALVSFNIVGIADCDKMQERSRYGLEIDLISLLNYFHSIKYVV